MIVVADASPFVGLLKVNLIDILPGLFGSVVIPPEVHGDLRKLTQDSGVRAFAASLPAWLTVRAPLNIEPIAGLHAGEQAAISLAREMSADILLIDEAAGRAAAIERCIPTFRTAAVMKQAADSGLIPHLAEAFHRLKSTNFRVPRSALDALLADHLARRRLR